jgi:SAM-dependent methyltransferase
MGVKVALRHSRRLRAIVRTLRKQDAPKDYWFTDHYDEWRERRIAAIQDHYGTDFFSGKSLLEVGCGYGDIGAAFSRLGANVTCSDAVPGHLKEVARRYPGIKTTRADLDGPWPFETFDICVHLGLLYHLRDPEASLRAAVQHSSILILETVVNFSDDPYSIDLIQESGYDQAWGGTGSRPSGAFVERVLTETGCTFERITDDRCNSGYHRYDWSTANPPAEDYGTRRMWFVKSPSA